MDNICTGLERKKKWVVYQRKLVAVIVLIVIWQLLSMWVDRDIFLPSVPDTFRALVMLTRTGEFYRSVGTSFLRIAAGFVLAVGAGILFAVIAELHEQIGEILQLFMQLVKSIPVASFVILVLLWVRSARLSTVISFLTVLPVVFTNVRGGIRQADKKLLEMAEVFRIGVWKKVRAIYLPAIRPAFVTACSVGLGFCFKSGIAAEVIGLPPNSIGGELYRAKLYLMTPELFAWTIVIVAVSVLFEKLVMWVIRVKGA
ncbi:MAG: ABC transporter permease subunit [Lachnospiraceae bacterium]|nr:ABC transporter permease subunit [Lachnospiraceae bacterium]